MSRGNFPPEGNEGKRSWWERHSQEIWEMPFTFVDIEGERARQSRDLQEGLMKSGVPDREVYARMEAEELKELKQFLQPMKDHLGAENDVSLLKLFELFRAYLAAAALNMVPESEIYLFLTEIAERFLRENPHIEEELLQEKDFWDYCELDPNDEDFSLAVQAAKQVQATPYLRDKIISALRSSV